MAYLVDFDPDETGTPLSPDHKIEAVRVCPFRHPQRKCKCELRPGYWDVEERVEASRDGDSVAEDARRSTREEVL